MPRTILDARLEAARKLLLSPAGRTPLADVAAQLGFASQAHFSRSYKEKFGISPLQDRKAGS